MVYNNFLSIRRYPTGKFTRVKYDDSKIYYLFDYNYGTGFNEFTITDWWLNYYI